MRFVVATLLATASFLSPISGFAESADVEATIKNIDMSNLSLTLDDGTHQASEEFNFEGFSAGAEGHRLHLKSDGKRVINDL